jgi:HK97 family phage major capsid protein
MADHSYPELDKLRSVEELTNHRTGVQQSLDDLDTEFEGLPFTEEVAETFAAKTEERAEIDRRISELNARKAVVAAASKDETRVEREAPAMIVRKTDADIYSADQFTGLGFRSIEDRNQAIRSNALRSLEASHLPKSAEMDNLAYFLDNKDEVDDQGSPEIARRVLITGSPIYKRAFAKYLKHGNTQAFTPEENRAAALAVTGTTTTGGYAVPYIFDPTMIHIGAFTAQNPYRQACRIETISAGNNWRTVTVGAVTSAYVTEAAAATEQGPTFGQPTYTVQRAHAFATVSIETLQDRPDITDELTGVFAESKATYEENQFTLGVGTTVFPLGMFVDTAYTDQTTVTNDVTAIADLQVVEAALPLRHRANAAWFMNRSTMRQLMALDTTYRYFSGAGINFPGQSNPTQPPAGGNTGLALLGYPIWEVPSAVSTLTTDGAIIAVFCDPKSYIIVDRIGMSVEVIQNMLNGATPSFPTGQRGIYCYWRNTAKPVNADAGRSLSVQ